MTDDTRSDGRRLEQLWAGRFGDEYTERNVASGDGRGAFWSRILAAFPVTTVLEVGCNVGANLRWIAAGRRAVGVDVNAHALDELRSRVPDALGVRGSARQLPFPDGSFDLAFTAGVLIHQSSDGLSEAMSEIVRCSRRYVLCAEYFSEEPVEVPYRGQTGALFKRDFGGLYQRQFPALALRERGFLSRAEGWDDVTYWIFQKNS